jgi:hypothetical protein
VNEKHFRSIVAVLGIVATGRLARGAYVKAVRLWDVDVLFGVFGHAWADNREVLFAVGAWRAGVDESVQTRAQIAIAHKPRGHGLSGGLETKGSFHNGQSLNDKTTLRQGRGGASPAQLTPPVQLKTPAADRRSLAPTIPEIAFPCKQHLRLLAVI